MPNAVFGPSPMQTGACGSNLANTVWDWMSKDWNADNKNGYPMVDGPFVGFNANFNLMGKPAPTVCTTPVGSCEDNNVCTNNDWDTNAAGPGECPCLNTANTASCDDGLYCNGTDTCANKTCGHSGDPCIAPLVCNETNNTCDNLCADAGTRCNDNNVCTNDSCIPATGECMHSNNTAACDDGNACTIGDVCSGGVCQAGAAKDCSDGKTCTNDVCTAGVCSNPVNCTGGQVCNAQGVCEAPVCNCPDDGNPCTDDVCVNNVCTHPNNTAACNDGNACTIGDVCSGGACQAGAAKDCSDGNDCTADSCDPATGCVYSNICPTGSDVGIAIFRAPSNIKACRNDVPIHIMVTNYGMTNESGSITLYKDGGAVKTWSNVVFYAGQNVNKVYHYNPRADGGETVQWQVVVNVPDDPDLSNNTSTVMTMLVAECKEVKNKQNNGNKNSHGK